MLRQIIVFTRDSNLESCRALAQSAKRRDLPCLFFKPFNSPFGPVIDQVLKGNCLIVPRTSGVLFDDWDLTLLQECIEKGAFSTHSPESIARLRDKDRQYLLLKKAGLHCLPTLIHRGPLSMNHLENFTSSEKWVVKSTRGNKGIGHQLLTSSELIHWWEGQVKKQDQRYIIQAFYEKTCEQRLLVLGEDQYLFQKKQGASWKKNASSSEFVAATPSENQKPYLKHMKKVINETLGLQTFAIDFFVEQESNHSYSILEVNAHPGMGAANAALGNEVNLYDDFINYFCKR